MLSRRFGINARTAAQSRIRVRAAMRLIEDALDGREYLVGDRFTVADLSAAALVAPLVGPPELPYRRPGVPLSPSLERIARELRDMPAGAWVLRMYERHRLPGAGSPPAAEAPTSDGAPETDRVTVTVGA
jgi:glutathione S-transferase